MSLSYRSILAILLAAKAIAAIVYILSGELPLAPDEAQYWLWSQNLDWGYYSKPPGVAWQIGLGTQLLGNTELGVRLGAVVIGTLLPLAVHRLARNAGLTEKGCFWAAVCMALSPMGWLATVLSTTDGGFVLFWAVAAAEGCRRQPSFFGIALAIAAGALFKWPIYLLWIPVALFHRSLKIVPAMALSLIGLLPSLIWNAQHDWATFRHVAATIAGRPGEHSGAPFFNGNFFDFLGAQVALTSPILFGLLIIGLIRGWKKPGGLRFCAFTTALFLGAYALLAMKQKMQGNWAVFAYPTAMVLVGWQAERYPRLAKVGVTLSLTLTLFLGALPSLQSRNISLFGWQPSYKLNLLRHNLGWNKLPALLEDYNPEKEFLFAATYQETCALSFYAPGQHRAYFLNLHSVRKNQFSYWPSLEEEEPIGANGYFLARGPAVSEYLQPYFDRVTLVAADPLFISYNKPMKISYLYYCEGYRGGVPPDPQVY